MLNFNENQYIINAVWQKGLIVPGLLPNIFRRDRYGTIIRYSDYGNRNSEYGWEIDHIIPKSRGGSDNLNNLQPLHWKNNCAKGDNLY